MSGTASKNENTITYVPLKIKVGPFSKGATLREYVDIPEVNGGGFQVKEEQKTGNLVKKNEELHVIFPIKKSHDGKWVQAINQDGVCGFIRASSLEMDVTNLDPKKEAELKQNARVLAGANEGYLSADHQKLAEAKKTALPKGKGPEYAKQAEALEALQKQVNEFDKAFESQMGPIGENIAKIDELLENKNEVYKDNAETLNKINEISENYKHVPAFKYAKLGQIMSDQDPSISESISSREYQEHFDLAEVQPKAIEAAKEVAEARKSYQVNILNNGKVQSNVPSFHSVNEGVFNKAAQNKGIARIFKEHQKESNHIEKIDQIAKGTKINVAALKEAQGRTEKKHDTISFGDKKGKEMKTEKTGPQRG